VLVWVTGGLYNASQRRRQARRGPGTARLIAVVVTLAIVVLAVLRAVPASAWNTLTTHAAWVQVLGTTVLVASTTFAVWARLVLGRMWTLGPVIQVRHRLHTDGPYAVTRHPIYTGLLGMLLGTVLIVGLGRALLIFPIGAIFLELKIRGEEKLLLESFPDDYPRYQRSVPQLFPRLHRHGDAGTGDA
jgi:protein-S-isoprenylcysteine O-methyltransferase Ste14